jgi:hypothetical protein
MFPDVKGSQIQIKNPGQNDSKGFPISHNLRNKQKKITSGITIQSMGKK